MIRTLILLLHAAPLQRWSPACRAPYPGASPGKKGGHQSDIEDGRIRRADRQRKYPSQPERLPAAGRHPGGVHRPAGDPIGHHSLSELRPRIPTSPSQASPSPRPSTTSAAPAPATTGQRHKRSCPFQLQKSGAGYLSSHGDLLFPHPSDAKASPGRR